MKTLGKAGIQKLRDEIEKTNPTKIPTLTKYGINIIRLKNVNTHIMDCFTSNYEKGVSALDICDKAEDFLQLTPYKVKKVIDEFLRPQGNSVFDSTKPPRHFLVKAHKGQKWMLTTNIDLVKADAEHQQKLNINSNKIMLEAMIGLKENK